MSANKIKKTKKLNEYICTLPSGEKYICTDLIPGLLMEKKTTINYEKEDFIEIEMLKSIDEKDISRLIGCTKYSTNC